MSSTGHWCGYIRAKGTDAVPSCCVRAAALIPRRDMPTSKHIPALAHNRVFDPAGIYRALCMTSEKTLRPCVIRESLMWMHQSNRHGAVPSRYVQAPILTPRREMLTAETYFHLLMSAFLAQASFARGHPEAKCFAEALPCGCWHAKNPQLLCRGSCVHP